MMTILSAALIAMAAEPASIDGVWLTEDESVAVGVGACEEDGETRCGVIVALPGSNEDADKEELCGAPVIWGLSYSERRERWQDGKILDAETEKTYQVRVERSGDNIQLRAYEGTPAFGETLIWTPVDEADLTNPCE